jgi:hypothetical protein
MTTMLQHIARHFREQELDGASADIRIVIRCPKDAADAHPAAKRVKLESASRAAATAAAAGAGVEDAA